MGLLYLVNKDIFFLFVLYSGAHCLQQEATVSLINSEESSKNLLHVLRI